MKHMKNILLIISAAALLSVCACSTATPVPTIEGSYSYEHAFSYDMYGNHFDVHETGTMDFYADSLNDIM